jgi:mercuric ion binding protein
MKTLNILFVVLLTFASGQLVSAQAKSKDQAGIKGPAVKTELFKVWGNCETCKNRIETAVKGEGVTNASWDQKTKLLTVTFDSEKTSRDALSKKLASVGHDTEKFKAPDEVYAKLPGCCKYDRSN